MDVLCVLAFLELEFEDFLVLEADIFSLFEEEVGPIIEESEFVLSTLRFLHC